MEKRHLRSGISVSTGSVICLLSGLLAPANSHAQPSPEPKKNAWDINRCVFESTMPRRWNDQYYLNNRCAFDIIVGYKYLSWRVHAERFEWMVLRIPIEKYGRHRVFGEPGKAEIVVCIAPKVPLAPNGSQWDGGDRLCREP
ncbi:hypothetical protein [Achromobacter marplatensis]|uniref:hypothetical protein n=1 Tax=Achromobacter marplatensis TaxID=470868 RepID=UPI00103CE602|nr:hypothetical protein [Achromobacter marplatensis]